MESLVRISETVWLAFAMTILMARSPRQRFLAEDLTGALGVHLSYPRKVLQRLVAAGLIDSTRGRHGGYRLARSPAEISLLDVFEAIEGPWEPPYSARTSRVCMSPDARRLLADVTDRAHRLIYESLQSSSLADLTSGTDESSGNSPS